MVYHGCAYPLASDSYRNLNMNFFQMMGNALLKIMEAPAKAELADIVKQMRDDRAKNLAEIDALITNGTAQGEAAVLQFFLAQVKAKPAISAMLALDPQIITQVSASLSSLFPANVSDSVEAFVAKQYDYLVAFLATEVTKL